MRCASCGSDNPEGTKFCGECGVPIQTRCPQCGFANLPLTKFCRECGTALEAAGKQLGAKSRKRQGAKKATRPAAPPPAAKSPPAAPEAERRQLTVMFCDLVGSTPLAEQLDPEELREVVRQYQEACEQVIHRFDGYVARYVGDALLVYFGYPKAHEDDAQRALRTGLGIVEAVQGLHARLQETTAVLRALPLQVRLGIHTGLVVVGEMGGRDYRESVALGETPNVAARLQGLAEPNAIVISAATYRLVQGLFVCQDGGLRALKGVSTPVQVYRVMGESDVHSRFEVTVRTGLTPLVGRDDELQILQRCWVKTQAGEGQIVLLSGEAGIGKSRLVQALKEQVAREGGTQLEFRCSPYYQNTAFYPVTEHFQRLLQFRREESPQEKLAKLEGMLNRYRFPLQEVMPLFAALLSLPHPDGYPPLTFTPQKQRQKTQEALGVWVLEEARRKPVLAIWEDLQWADPSTLELHGLFADRITDAPLLTVFTYRPEFRPPWAMHTHVTPLTLSRLSHRQVEEVVGRVTGGCTLPAEVLQQIVTKTDGVPLFVEELTKMVLESGLVRQTNKHYDLTGSLPSLAIPATLQGSLMARLDRLDTAKEVAQLGATMGREFSYELIQAVLPADEVSVQHALARLVEAELLYQQGLPPQSRYIFKHALIQDAAYQSLLKSTRQQYHQQIAQVLEERFPETKETQLELLAYHYTEAGLVAQAIPYWQQAGERAVERSANIEAVSHLTKGLEVLQILPDTPARIQQELALQVPLGSSLMATKGYAAPEVARVQVRLRELCRQAGVTPQVFRALPQLRGFHHVRAELQTARELAEQHLALAQRVQNQDLLLWAYYGLGETLYHVGELAPARSHLEQGVALNDAQQVRSVFVRAVQNPRVACLAQTAQVLWHLGYPDQAQTRMQEAMTLAQELAHPFSLAWALCLAVHQPRREARATQERAEAAIALSTEQGFPYFLALGTILRGWALAAQDQAVEGIAQIRQGLVAYRATGAEVWRPYLLALLAEAYGKGKQKGEGFNMLTEALEVVDKTGERVHEAELYRLKGELMLQQFQVPSSKFQADNPQSAFRISQSEAEAEACFHKAIDIARRQRAKSLELRAVMSVSRLWQQQGKKAEARQTLAEIYGWFTEGFDTKDLQEAKSLLEELH